MPTELLEAKEESLLQPIRNLPPVNETDPEMPECEDGKYVSEQEYWEYYYEHPDYHYEWNNGILEVKPLPNKLSMLIKRWFMFLLEEYLRSHGKGELVSDDIGFRLDLGYKSSVRKPDMSVILADNSNEFQDFDRSFKGIYDMCIEFLSHSTKREIERDTKTKRTEYEGIKVKEYYIIDDRQEETRFYRLTKEKIYKLMDVT